MVALPVYETKFEHIPLTLANGQIDLGDWVIGLSVRILQSSTGNDMNFGIDEAPRIPLNIGDRPAEYGPFFINTIPAVIRGLFQYSYVVPGASPQALLVLTRLVPVPVEGLKVVVCN